MTDPTGASLPGGERPSPRDWANLRASAAPVDIRGLPDAAVGSCRLAGEWLALATGLGVLVAVLGALLIFDFQSAELGVAGFTAVWLGDTALKLLVLSRQVGGAVEITPSTPDAPIPQSSARRPV